MEIASLFVNIGLKGDTKVKSALGETRQGMNQLGTNSLWTKAAILGVFYALEQLVSQSNQLGTELNQFGAFTGQSAEKLQRYGFAARQVGGTVEDVKSSVAGLSSAMAKLQTTGQMPAGMTVIGRAVGGLDRKQLNDSFYLLNKVQQFLRTTKMPVGMANEMALSMGVTADTIAAMRKNAFNPEALARAPFYTDKQTSALTKMNAQWGNLSQTVQMGIGDLNLKHGGQMIKDLTMITKEVLHLVDAMATLAKNARFFEGIAKVFQGWGIIVKELTDTVNEFNKKGFWGGTKEVAKGVGSKAVDSLNILDFMTGAPDRRVQGMLEDADRAAAFKHNFQGGHVQGQKDLPAVHQTLNFNGVKGAEDAAHLLRAAASDAGRQSPALHRND